MKKLIVAMAILMCTSQAWSHLAVAEERFPTGFYSPTGSNLLQIRHGWLDSGCGPAEPYEFDFYHTGDDNALPFGSSVYAVWDGVVVAVSSNGWGEGNVGLVIKSKRYRGGEFLWLVGHVTSSLGVNAPVQGGEVIATVGHWPGGDHVHFGVFPGTTPPTTDTDRHIGWGKMGCSNWQDARTFLSTFGANLQWDLAWELRWALFSFTQNRSVMVYHATSKADPSQRALIFWDPDRKAWDGWSAASESLGAPSRDVQAKQDMLDRSLSDSRFVGRPSTNGFVDPIEWLTTQVPDDPLNTQAANDTVKRALGDARFSGSGQNFIVDVNWDPSWELRGQDFVFGGNRVVTVWHVTLKTNRSVRYTGFFDPDRGNAWSGWLGV